MAFEVGSKTQLLRVAEAVWGTSPVSLTGSVGVDSAAKTFTRATGSFITDGYLVGMPFTASGFTNGGNNGAFVVSGVTALVLTASAATTLVTEVSAAGRTISPSMTKGRFTDVSLDPVMAFVESKEIRGDRMTSDVRGTTLNGEGDVGFELAPADFDDLLEAALGGTWTVNVLKAGTAQKSFTMEVGHLGINQYKLLTGCLIDKLSLSIKPNAIVTGKYSVIAKGFAIAGTTAATSTTPAGGLGPFDAQNAATIMKEGGTTIAIVSGLDFALDNGTEKATVVGTKNLVGAQFGRSKITGTLTALFQDAAMLTKFLNETATSIECTLSNGTKSLAFKFGNVKFTGAKADVTTEGLLGINLPFTALYDGVTGSNLQITRVP